MKKSLVPLALAALAGAASAQSSVTLYGVASFNISHSNPGSNVAGGSLFRINDGTDFNGWRGSRWGLRGTENLSPGVDAFFVLESGFRLDTGESASGTSASSVFGRRAALGLRSKELGEFSVGRQDAFSRTIHIGFADSTDRGELKLDESVAGGRQLFGNFGSRINNSVRYETPSFGGFRVAALVGLGESTQARYNGVMASFRNGPVAVAAGYEEYSQFGARDGGFNRTAYIAGNYDFGVVKLYAGYQDISDVGVNTGAAIAAAGIRDQQGYNIGVVVPLGQLQLRAQYTHVEYDLNDGTSADQQKYGVSLRYPLSKRTTIYAAASMRDGDNPGGVDASDNFVDRINIVPFGLIHSF